MRLRLAAVAITWLISGSLFAQALTKVPQEVENLHRFAGHWTSEVTRNPAMWTPDVRKLRTTNFAEMVLDGWFAKHIEVNHVVEAPEQVTKALWYQTFDPQSEKYVTWFFQSSGMLGHAEGVWDQAEDRFVFTPSDLPTGTKGQHIEGFATDHKIHGSYRITGLNGEKLFDMEWIRTRQPGVAGQPLEERWSKMGTPIEPIPAENKKLQPFIGEWESEFTQGPSVVSPNGGTAHGTMTAKWILDGRWLYGTTHVGTHHSQWVMGYDPNTQAYRYLRFTNTGQAIESTGQWNTATNAFDWTLADPEPGITRTYATRILEDGTVQGHLVDKNDSGKVHMDLTIKTIRKK